MKRLALVAMVLATVWSVGAASADDFYVIVGGGVGTKITRLPCIISNPGFYYLTGNLSYSDTGGAGIAVGSNDVVIDLMGFRLKGPGPGSYGDSSPVGIYSGHYNNVEVRNGTISGWRTCFKNNGNSGG